MSNYTPAALNALSEGDFENFLAASSPGGIEAQEAAGQRTFVAGTTLPKEMLHGCTREKLEAMGIVFGEPADDLFVNVTLPEGWKKQATDHSMWSELLDDKGRVRAAIFYKAAFYDRNAHICLNCRFLVYPYALCDASGATKDFASATHCKVVVKDGREEFKSFGVYEKNDYDTSNILSAEAVAWLKVNYPDYTDPLAYWD